MDKKATAGHKFVDNKPVAFQPVFKFGSAPLSKALCNGPAGGGHLSGIKGSARMGSAGKK